MKRGVAERMKILLFNDNPVVRKLVALSAQKTKDELSVIWSVDEVEESEYDLLIVDDALYSDDMFESLKEHITYKSTLLMATRGQAVPAGFDQVINKPFLPTDLVDMFIQIEKKVLMSPVAAPKVVKLEEEAVAQEPFYAINLENELPNLETIPNEFESFDLDEMDDDQIDFGENVSDDFSLDGLDDVETSPSQTTILDKEEVQEVQNLLDDTEGDDWNSEDEIILKEIDELDIGDDEFNTLVDDTVDEVNETLEDDLLSDDTLLDGSELSGLNEELLDEDEFGLEDNFDPISLASSEVEETDFADEILLPSLEDDLLLDDDELGDLELQIEDAVSGLEAQELEQELELEDMELDFEDTVLENFDLTEAIEASVEVDGLDEFAMLNERDLKLAIGEEVEEEPEIKDEGSVVENDFFDDSEEEVETQEPLQKAEDQYQPLSASHAEGVEALQALLKALSNEEVTKSLKGLNISININFGNDA